MVRVGFPNMTEMEQMQADHDADMAAFNSMYDILSSAYVKLEVARSQDATKHSRCMSHLQNEIDALRREQQENRLLIRALTEHREGSRLRSGKVLR